MKGSENSQQIIEQTHTFITNNMALIEQAATIVGTVCVALAVGYVAISVVIELVEIIFLFTPGKKDDDWIAKVRIKWVKLKPYIEWLTVKTPLTKVLDKVLSVLQTIKAAILVFRQKKIEKKKEVLENEKRKIEKVGNKQEKDRIDAKISRLTQRLKNLK